MVLKFKKISHFFIILFFFLFTSLPAFSGWQVKFGEGLIYALKSQKITMEALGQMAKSKSVPEISALMVKSGIKEESRSLAALAVAVLKGRIDPGLADDLLRNLGHVDGFSEVIKRVIAADISNIRGAMFEMEAARVAMDHGFRVVQLRKVFNDGLKKAISDLDIILKHGNKKIVIECKAWGDHIPSHIIEADAKTLLAFSAKDKNVVPVFLFQNNPGEHALKILDDMGVHYTIGNLRDAFIHLLELLV